MNGSRVSLGVSDTPRSPGAPTSGRPSTSDSATRRSCASQSGRHVASISDPVASHAVRRSPSPAHTANTGAGSRRTRRPRGPRSPRRQRCHSSTRASVRAIASDDGGGLPTARPCRDRDRTSRDRSANRRTRAHEPDCGLQREAVRGHQLPPVSCNGPGAPRARLAAPPRRRFQAARDRHTRRAHLRSPSADAARGPARPAQRPERPMAEVRRGVGTRLPQRAGCAAGTPRPLRRQARPAILPVPESRSAGTARGRWRWIRCRSAGNGPRRRSASCSSMPCSRRSISSANRPAATSRRSRCRCPSSSRSCCSVRIPSHRAATMGIKVAADRSTGTRRAPTRIMPILRTSCESRHHGLVTKASRWPGASGIPGPL